MYDSNNRVFTTNEYDPQPTNTNIIVYTYNNHAYLVSTSGIIVPPPTLICTSVHMSASVRRRVAGMKFTHPAHSLPFTLLFFYTSFNKEH